MSARRALALAALLAAAPVGLAAQEGQSKAEGYGLNEEQPTVIRGQVVDIACLLSGECPAGCGGGSRQLGLLQADGRLVLPAKNGELIFTGAVQDLLPHCGRMVEADGLMVGPASARIYMLQTLRPEGAAEAKPADAWSKAWTAADSARAGKAEEWFRHDPRVLEAIGRRGYLGLGAEADLMFMRAQ